MEFITPFLREGGAIALAALAIWIVYKITSNHINHNTEILAELKEAIHHLTEFLKNGHK